MENTQLLANILASASYVSVILLMLMPSDMEIFMLLRMKTKGLMTCFNCDKAATMTCQRCKLIKFCNRDCLKEAWPEHKKACNPLRHNRTESDIIEIDKLIKESRLNHYVRFEDADKWELMEVPAKFVYGKLVQRFCIKETEDTVLFPVRGLEMRLLLAKDLLFDGWVENESFYNYCRFSEWYETWKNHMDIYLTYGKSDNKENAEKMTKTTKLIRTTIDENLHIIITKSPILSKIKAIHYIPKHENRSCGGKCSSVTMSEMKNCFIIDLDKFVHKSSKFMIDCGFAKYNLYVELEKGIGGTIIQESVKINIRYYLTKEYFLDNVILPEEEELKKIYRSYELGWNCWRHPWSFGKSCASCSVQKCVCKKIGICAVCIKNKRLTNKVVSIYCNLGPLELVILDDKFHKDVSMLVADYCWKDMRKTCKFFYIRYQHLLERKTNFELTDVAYQEDCLEYLLNMELSFDNKRYGDPYEI